MPKKVSKSHNVSHLEEALVVDTAESKSTKSKLTKKKGVLPSKGESPINGGTPANRNTLFRGDTSSNGATPTLLRDIQHKICRTTVGNPVVNSATLSFRVTLNNSSNAYPHNKCRPCKLKQIITMKLRDEVTTVSLDYPPWLNKSHYPQYSKSVFLYLEFIFQTLNSVLTEEEVFYLAVVAQHYEDVAGLHELDTKINKLSDDYFWLYLAKEPTFSAIVDVELFRRRAKTTLPLIELDDYDFTFKEATPDNIAIYTDVRFGQDKDCGKSKYFATVIREGVRSFPHNSAFVPACLRYLDAPVKLVNMNMGCVDESLLYYDSELLTIIDEIVQAGGIIAGGFPNNLINPVYFSQHVSANALGNKFDQNESLLNDDSHCCVALGREIFRAPFEIGHHQQDERYHHFHAYIIPGLVECVRAFHCTKGNLADRGDCVHRNRTMMESEEVRFKNYDLDYELWKLKQYLYTVDDKIYFTKFIRAGDVDIFFVGEDSAAKAARVTEILMAHLSEINTTRQRAKVHFSEFATTFHLGKGMPKFQIIKRAYSSVEEILAGFDLNASRVAIVPRSVNRRAKAALRRWKLVAPQAYIDAVEYGINVVVPAWQSETFNLRLCKYRSKGYQLYFPGQILHRFGLSRHIGLQTGSTAGCEGLLKYYNDYLWGPNRSDYIPNQFHEGRSFPQLAGKKQIHYVSIASKHNIFTLANATMLYLNMLLEEVEDDTSFQSQLGLSLALAKYVSALFWRTTNPGSQLTGSFNPTQLDYLCGNKREISIKRIEDPYIAILAPYMSASLITIVLDYSGTYDVDYNNITKFAIASLSNSSILKLGEQLLHGVEHDMEVEYKFEPYPSRTKNLLRESFRLNLRNNLLILFKSIIRQIDGPPALQEAVNHFDEIYAAAIRQQEDIIKRRKETRVLPKGGDFSDGDDYPSSEIGDYQRGENSELDNVPIINKQRESDSEEEYGQNIEVYPHRALGKLLEGKFYLHDPDEKGLCLIGFDSTETEIFYWGRFPPHFESDGIITRVMLQQLTPVVLSEAILAKIPATINNPANLPFKN